MDIAKQTVGEAVELALSGRLDAYWADRLAHELDAAIRDGHRRLRLDLANLDFISSAGLRVLLRAYKQVQALSGSLRITDCSAPVKTVIALAGFESLLGVGAASADASPARTTEATATPSARIERGAMRYDLFDLGQTDGFRCRTIGEFERAQTTGFGPADCRTIHCPDGTLALGVGAFGQDFDDCRARFGEWLAVAGHVAMQPTDGTNKPDFQVQAGAFLPDIQTLWGVLAEGAPTHQFSFDGASPGATVALADLADLCLDRVGAEAASLVVVAEAATLSGVALAASPVQAAVAGADWTYPQSVVLLVGLVARTAPPALAGLLRPVGAGPFPTGVCHAAVFPFRPITRGKLALREIVSALFEAETPQGLVRVDAGGPIGASGPEGKRNELLRGLCWFGPVTAVTRDG